MFVSRQLTVRNLHSCETHFVEAMESLIDFTSPKSVRNAIRSEKWNTSTSGLCPGYLQANMVIMKEHQSEYFEKFCRANPQPCPLLAVLPPGVKEAVTLAPDSDVAMDLPKYRVYQNGILIKEVADIEKLWTDDMVTFLIGCSFSFESHLLAAGIPVRNIEQNKQVSMFITTRMCVPIGPFSCPMVVSYRPVPGHLVQIAKDVTLKFPAAHGPPVHVGDPAVLGIEDLSKPDFGDTVTAEEGDVPMFWACGVTSTLAAISPNESGLIITHAPCHMFITDINEFA